MILKQKNTIIVQSDISFTVIYRFNSQDNIIFVQNKNGWCFKKYDDIIFFKIIR